MDSPGPHHVSWRVHPSAANSKALPITSTTSHRQATTN